jgi:2-polyprenyl-3-methyl-5-hydroxy-6-metoxy-1,4-benzoquinol methylase
MNDRTQKFYNAKDRAYYAHARTDITAMVQGRDLKVLDVGCGQGATLLELKRSGQAAVVVGVEINPEAAREAGYLLDWVIVGDIENLDLNYPNGYFDLIILSDVLEHLVDPWSTLKKLKKYLAHEGRVIASLPNLREFGTIRRLLFQGDFKYSQAGIMDKTHLRFFCKKNMVELFQDGFEITEIKTVPELLRGEVALFNRLTFRIFEEFLVIQYIIEARNKIIPGQAPEGGRNG